MVISSRQKLQSLNDYTMNIHIDGVPINQSNQSKSLGLIIDENLSWKARIHEISKKVSSVIGALKDVRAHCYCASPVRTLFIGHARATSFSSARTESKT